MKNIDKLMNERAELWEDILTTEFKHRHHPTAFTKESWDRAVQNLKDFDEKINNLFGL